MNFSFSEILFVLVIIQLFFICFFLFSHNKGRRTSNLLLGFFFLSISLNLLDSFLVLKKVWLTNPNLVGWGICMPLLFGPLLFLYTESILYKDFRLYGRKWLHFLPFFLCFIFSAYQYLSLGQERQVDLINRIFERNLPPSLYWSSALIFLQFFLYIAASFRLIDRYRRIASDHYSDQEKVNISWLSSTILFFTLCMILAAINGFSGLTPFSKYYFLVLNILVLLIFIFISRVLLKALTKPEIFSVMEEAPATRMEGGEIPKYPGSAISEEDRKRMLENLNLHMRTRKPYLEPELSLEQLSAQIFLKPKILSQLINESLGQNFFDFVNHYRIEEAKRLLTNPTDKKITILEVLYEVGFNSKSSFNTLFKKYTGLTPSEFKKKHIEG
ncbi:MAG: helix-turn-helix domain-containing protein [Chitinophagales bacterium]